jgi:hypothetical protein
MNRKGQQERQQVALPVGGARSRIVYIRAADEVLLEDADLRSLLNYYLAAKISQDAVKYTKFSNRSNSAFVVMNKAEDAQALCSAPHGYISDDIQALEPYEFAPCPEGYDPYTLAIFGWTQTLKEFKEEHFELISMFGKPTLIRDKDFIDSQGGLRKIILITFEDFDTAAATKLIMQGDHNLRVDFAKKYEKKAQEEAAPATSQTTSYPQKAGGKQKQSSFANAKGSGRNIVDYTHCEDKKCSQTPTHGTVVARTTRWCAKHAPKASYIVNVTTHV